MQKKFYILILIIAVSTMLMGCKSSFTELDTQNIQDISQVNLDELFKYKNSYVGDNSAIGNIISNLPANTYIYEFSLKTDQKPYGVVIKYNSNREENIDNYDKFWRSQKPEQLLEKNAIILFSLVPNVDIIEFNVAGLAEETYKYDRVELEGKYNRDLETLTDYKESFKEFF